jgi:hypothetical protein
MAASLSMERVISLSRPTDIRTAAGNVTRIPVRSFLETAASTMVIVRNPTVNPIPGSVTAGMTAAKTETGIKINPTQIKSFVLGTICIMTA